MNLTELHPNDKPLSTVNQLLENQVPLRRYNLKKKVP